MITLAIAMSLCLHVVSSQRSCVDGEVGATCNFSINSTCQWRRAGTFPRSSKWNSLSLLVTGYEIKHDGPEAIRKLRMHEHWTAAWRTKGIVTSSTGNGSIHVTTVVKGEQDLSTRTLCGTNKEDHCLQISYRVKNPNGLTDVFSVRVGEKQIWYIPSTEKDVRKKKTIPINNTNDFKITLRMYLDSSAHSKNWPVMEVFVYNIHYHKRPCSSIHPETNGTKTSSSTKPTASSTTTTSLSSSTSTQSPSDGQLDPTSPGYLVYAIVAVVVVVAIVIAFLFVAKRRHLLCWSRARGLNDKACFVRSSIHNYEDPVDIVPDSGLIVGGLGGATSSPSVVSPTVSNHYSVVDDNALSDHRSQRYPATTNQQNGNAADGSDTYCHLNATGTAVAAAAAGPRTVGDQKLGGKEGGARNEGVMYDHIRNNWGGGDTYHHIQLGVQPTTRVIDAVYSHINP